VFCVGLGKILFGSKSAASSVVAFLVCRPILLCGGLQPVGTFSYPVGDEYSVAPQYGFLFCSGAVVAFNSTLLLLVTFSNSAIVLKTSALV
jgi:hypothetical protein